MDMSTEGWLYSEPVLSDFGRLVGLSALTSTQISPSDDLLMLSVSTQFLVFPFAFSRYQSTDDVSCGGRTRVECLCYIQCIIIVFTYYNVAP